jgi:urease accessory protein
LKERLDQGGAELKALAELGGSGASACFANAVLLGESADAEAWRAGVAALHGDGLWAGVSELRRAGWSIKLVANDAVRLRSALRETRRILAEYFPRLRCDARKL